MARTIKKGLDYFPVDTNILSDLKVRRIKREYGAESFLLYMTLLCDIYANGYWLEANDDYLFDLSEQMQISESRILEMLQAMAKVGMFDADLFTEQQILTSEPIQKQYFCIKKKYIEYHGLTNLPYLVISELIGITAEKSRFLRKKVHKEKKRKVKKKKRKLHSLRSFRRRASASGGKFGKRNCSQMKIGGLPPPGSPDKGSDSTFYCRPNWMNFATSSFPAEKKKVSRRKKTLSAVSTTGCPITERRKKPGRRKNGNHGCRKSWRWTGSAMFLLKLRNKYLPGNALRTCQPGI